MIEKKKEKKAFKKEDAKRLVQALVREYNKTLITEVKV
jgi:hypothetical protein